MIEKKITNVIPINNNEITPRTFTNTFLKDSAKAIIKDILEDSEIRSHLKEICTAWDSGDTQVDFDAKTITTDRLSLGITWVLKD